MTTATRLLSVLHLKRREYQEALDIHERMLKLNPNDNLDHAPSISPKD